MSFQQGLSGLNAANQNLDVIGNNIANANTIGAKSATAEFAGLYAAAVSGSKTTSQSGIGVNVTAVAQNFSQGTITTTSNPLDLAINGAGFFQVQTVGDATPQYSRNGQFNIDANGYIVNASLQQLMGYAANANGTITPGSAVPLQMSTGNVPPNPTQAMTMTANLDSAGKVTAPAAGGITYTDPTTYNNATSVTTFDGKGQAVSLTYYFQKASAGDPSAAPPTGDTWNVFATANGTDISGTTPPTALTQITFDTNGANPTMTNTNAAGLLTVAVPATTSYGAISSTLDLNKLTEYGTAFGVTSLTQDGYASGQLSGLAIGKDGIITANYSNGQSRTAGQVLLANFRNPQGLQPLGNNDWAQTPASGTPVTGAPGQGSLGLVQSAALEQSNVDLTAELVNMITAQRVYQANAQTIKTQDQVMQTLVSLR
ncbi:MAG: flagellar hook protein FlgE [Burkholderiales bacterium]|nr:flagellar hook protein FlgE [Burkholderiales bacterium]